MAGSRRASAVRGRLTALQLHQLMHETKLGAAARLFFVTLCVITAPQRARRTARTKVGEHSPFPGPTPRSPGSGHPAQLRISPPMLSSRLHREENLTNQSSVTSNQCPECITNGIRRHDHVAVHQWAIAEAVLKHTPFPTGTLDLTHTSN
jgi:hypothetical protein